MELQPRTPQPRKKGGKRRSLPPTPTSAAARTPRQHSLPIGTPVGTPTRRPVIETPVPPLLRWRRRMVPEELSRQRILTWLEERRKEDNERFRRRVEEICEAELLTNLTYLHVKKKLVVEFGLGVFTEHKEVLREVLSSVAATNSPHISDDDSDPIDKVVGNIEDSDNLDVEGEEKGTGSSAVEAAPHVTPIAVVCDDAMELMEMVKSACIRANGTDIPITWLRLKTELIESFGESLVIRYKREIQEYLTKSLEDDAERLARREQVVADISRRLESLEDNEENADERRLLIERLAEFDMEIAVLRAQLPLKLADMSMDNSNEKISLDQSPSSVPIGLDQLPIDVLSRICSVGLSTRTMLLVLPRVCKRFRAIMTQYTNVILNLEWARLYVTDRVLMKKLLPRIGQLEVLDLSHCDRVTTAGCKALQNKSSELRVLNLTGCTGIKDAGLELFADNCPLLEDAVLYDCSLSGAAIGSLLKSCSQLKRLDIGRSDTDYEPLNEDDIRLILESLGNSDITGIRHLGLEQTVISTTLFSSLISLAPSIISIDLGYTGLDDSGVAVLTKLKELQSCRITGNRSITGVSVVQLLQSCPQLQLLDVSGCSNLKGDALANASSVPLALTSLEMRNCQISDNALQALTSNTPNLYLLDVGYCDGLTDIGIMEMAENCPHLRTLSLQCCFLVSSKSIEQIGQSCKKMSKINLQGCSRISDNGIMSLASGCVSLLDVDMSRCKSITDTGILALLNQCSSLKHCVVEGCPKVSVEVAKLLPSIVIEEGHIDI